MTNEEKLKSLSTEEWADIMSNAVKDCSDCPIYKFCTLSNYNHTFYFDTCPDTWKKWFKSEVEE